MAQIRSKQIADFLTTVNWAEVTNSKIANASDVKAYVDQEVEALGLDANASIDSLETALSAEIVATNADVDGLNEAIDALGAKHDAEMEAHHTEHTSLIEAEAVARANGDTELAELIRAEEERAGNEEGRLAAAISVEEDRIDAILLASDADKDSFKEIVSLINAVDTVNDDALANVISDLNAEISATNSDVTSINTRVSKDENALAAEVTRATTAEGSLETRLSLDENALAAEIAATDADVARLELGLDKETEARISGDESLTIRVSNEEVARADADAELAQLIQAEEERATAVEGSLETRLSKDELALAAEIAATDADVESIDLRLGEVSGDLVDSVDSLEVALSAEIVATNSDVTRLEGDFTSVNTRVSKEESRVDAILLASDADKDSFAEIVSLINAVDTVNDNAFAGYVLSNDASIDSLEVALSAEIVATNGDVDGLNEALVSLEAKHNEEMEAHHNEHTSLIEAEAVTRREADVELNLLIQAETERAEGVEAGHDTRIAELEATIIEDNEMFVETFVGEGLNYIVAQTIQDENAALVTAFVNGHYVPVASVKGQQVTLVDPNYGIDGGDVVTITYQK